MPVPADVKQLNYIQYQYGSKHVCHCDTTDRRVGELIRYTVKHTVCLSAVTVTIALP
jgi:hypothetical protein